MDPHRARRVIFPYYGTFQYKILDVSAIHLAKKSLNTNYLQHGTLMSEFRATDPNGTFSLYLFCKKITIKFKIFLKEVQNRLVKFFYIVKLGRLDILKCVSQENNKRQEISKKFPLKLFQETNKYGRRGAESTPGKNRVKKYHVKMGHMF